MTAPPDLLEDLRIEASILQRLNLALAKARRERDETIEAALAAGKTKSEIASAAGLSLAKIEEIQKRTNWRRA